MREDLNSLVLLYRGWIQFSGMLIYNVIDNFILEIYWEIYSLSNFFFDQIYINLDFNVEYLSQILINIRNNFSGIEIDFRLVDQSL